MIEGDGAMGVSGGCTKSTSYFQKYCSRGWSAQSTRPREKKEYEDERRKALVPSQTNRSISWPAPSTQPSTTPAQPSDQSAYERSLHS
jgi:hypothetical protein